MSMGGKEVTAYFDKFLAGEMEVGGRVLQERNLGGKGGISIRGRWLRDREDRHFIIGIFVS